MSETEDYGFYLVRTIEELFYEEKVGIGWSDFNFSLYNDPEQAIEDIENDYGIGRKSNQIRRFFEIKQDDFIVVPLPYEIAIGRAKGKRFYDEDYYDDDRANQLKITVPKNDDGDLIKIPRASLSEALQRRIRVQGMTVNDLSEFADEIFEAYSSVQSGTEYSWTNQIYIEIERKQKDFKERLLSNIQSGKTNLQTGGMGLEELIKELLTLDGYQAKVLPKNKFSSFADADIQASRSDRCALVNLLVQVKHHQGYSNDYGLSQLKELRELHSSEYEGFELVFLTSASVSDDMIKKADEMNIKVLQGEDLVDWITEHIDDLSNSTKQMLGIFEVPSIL